MVSPVKTYCFHDMVHEDCVHSRRVETSVCFSYDVFECRLRNALGLAKSEEFSLELRATETLR